MCSALGMQQFRCMRLHVDCGRSLEAYTMACLSSRRAASSLKAQRLASSLARTICTPLTGAGTKSAGELGYVHYSITTALHTVSLRLRLGIHLLQLGPRLASGTLAKACCIMLMMSIRFLPPQCAGSCRSVDGVQYGAVSTHCKSSGGWRTSGAPGSCTAPFDQPFGILLNVAAGGSLPGRSPSASTAFPQIMLVRATSGTPAICRCCCNADVQAVCILREGHQNGLGCLGARHNLSQAILFVACR